MLFNVLYKDPAKSPIKVVTEHKNYAEAHAVASEFCDLSDCRLLNVTPFTVKLEVQIDELKEKQKIIDEATAKKKLKRLKTNEAA